MIMLTRCSERILNPMLYTGTSSPKCLIVNEAPARTSFSVKYIENPTEQIDGLRGMFRH